MLSPEERANFRLEEGVLGPVHWRSIEKLYADHVSSGKQAMIMLLERHAHCCTRLCLGA